MNSVSEQIDERILRLLGLEDVFDLDYDTYLTELKEAIVKGSFGNTKLPDEELAMLANERKRIRGKKGRFKPKSQKITADKVSSIKLLKGTKKTALIPSAVNKESKIETSSEILKPLESISNTLLSLLRLKKKTGEEERKGKERDKRTKKEEGLEGFKKGISAVAGAAKKMLAPFQSIIDRIWKFIFFTLLGRAFTQLMNWLGDPANKKKIDVLGRFLKDWWPALAFAAGLFLTPFGAFIRTTIGMLKGFVPRMAGIAKIIAANPLLFGTTALAAGAGIAGASLEQSLKKLDDTLLQKKIQESKDKGKPLSKQEIEKIKLEQLQKRIQDIQGTAIPGSALASGGVVPRFSGGGINFGTGYDGIDGNTGQKVSGFGPDTQAIIAQPGEIVINKKTVDAVGADHFLSLNRMHGGPGANKPKMGRLYNTGGMVGMQGGGWLNQLGRFLPETGTVMAPSTTGNQTIAGYRDKLLGINIGKTRYPKDTRGYGTGYSMGQMRRFEQLNINKQFVNRGGTLPALVNRQNFVGDSFRNFGSNVRTIQGAAKRQEEMMRQMGHSPDGYVNIFGQPIRRQGGGEIPQGPFTPLPSPGYSRPQGSFIPKPIFRLPGPMPGTTVPFGYNPFMGLKSGGLIKENTGTNIRGATADRQLTALQPGEYVLPVDTVNNLGVSLIDRLVAMSDSNSTAAKLGRGKVQRYTPTPLRRSGSGGVITLPAITQSAMGNGMASGGMVTKQVPSFSASSPSGASERSMNASIYGIVG
jgi:hypothetical protein